MSGANRKPKFVSADTNHNPAIGWYRDQGCSVEDLRNVGNGVSDLLIGCAGITDLAEVKFENGGLRPSQKTFNERWRGSRPWITRTLDDAISHVADMRRRARGLAA